MSLNSSETPCLVLDKQKLLNNTAKLTSKFKKLGIPFRPHLKTTKCEEIAKIALDGIDQRIMVSTLKEAEYFSSMGIKDIIYGVGFVAEKLPRLAKLFDNGATVHIVVDSLDAISLLTKAAGELNHIISILIEIDSDGTRAGIKPDSPHLLKIAQEIRETKNLTLSGVMTHAGSSYRASNIDEIIEIAEQERLAVISSADTLRKNSHDISIITAGSTPTATFGKNFDGLTEVRAGVYMFMDLFQANLGVCEYSDIAVSVLTTVISHQPERNRIIVDAGALALSQDRGTQNQSNDCGFGLVMDSTSDDEIHENMFVCKVSQEQGQITTKNGNIDFEQFPIGKKLRILPNHACMTVAPYDCYHVIDDGEIVVWNKISGW